MNAIAIQGNQKQFIQDKIKYVLRNIQYLQGRQVVPKGQMRLTDIYFAHITDQALQIRLIRQQNMQHFSIDQDVNFQQILKVSVVLDAIGLPDLIKVDKKIITQKTAIPHYVIGIYNQRKDVLDKTKTSIVIRLINEDKMNQFFTQVNTKIEEQKQFLKKSETNYNGIQQNIRKIVQKILVSSIAKRQVFNRIIQKISKRNIYLTCQQNKMMIYSLIGNNIDMQNFLRKQKIEVFDIQKKKYEDQIKQQSLINIVSVLQPNQQNIIQGYSEKRKLDGVVPKRLNKKELQTNNNKNMEQQFIQRIPYRSERQLSEFLGLQNNFQRMEIQDKIIPKLPQSYRIQKVKIPVKQYSLICKQIQLVRKQQIVTPQILDRNMQVIIEVVKFMYQLMKTNTRQKIQYSLAQGPLDKVLDCLKDVLTQCTQKRLQNKSIVEFVDKANKNYLAYRKNPNKFY